MYSHNAKFPQAICDHLKSYFIAETEHTKLFAACRETRCA